MVGENFSPNILHFLLNGKRMASLIRPCPDPRPAQPPARIWLSAARNSATVNGFGR